MSAADAFAAGTMTWLLGIEDTVVYPPARFAMQPLDEHDLTGHTEQWRADLTAVADLGATALRYGVQWPRVHTAPGNFDWSALDQRLQFAAGELGLTVIADLVHYGTPTWLEGSFADPGYPDAIAEFAAEFAARYRGLVDHLTPLNEPTTTASFCGLRGIWPPALTGWAGWCTVTLNIVDGIRATITAARAANPAVQIVHVEASALYEAATAALEDHAELLRQVAELPLQLLLGRVGSDHPMWGWLLSHGSSPERLQRLRRRAPELDFLGVNYYPDLTPRRLYPSRDSIEQVPVNRWTAGLEGCLRAFADRYRLPMLVTETSIEGSPADRAAWVVESARAVTALTEAGLDIRGYTWWPLMDFVDWSYASGGRNVEEFVITPIDDGAPVPSATAEVFGDISAGKTGFLRRMGLLALEEQADGTLTRIPTEAAEAFRAHVHLATSSTRRLEVKADHVR